MRMYSSDEEEAMRRMVEAGCTLPEIAEVLPERNPEGIRNKIRAMGLGFVRHGTRVNRAAMERILKLRKA